jgi:hypothetical protein
LWTEIIDGWIDIAYRIDVAWMVKGTRMIDALTRLHEHKDEAAAAKPEPRRQKRDGGQRIAPNRAAAGGARTT